VKWNYRVIEFVDPHDNEPWQAIHEVYYDVAGLPNGYAENPAGVVSHDAGNNKADLRWVLDRMREALSKPVLVQRDFERAADHADAERSET
jgi:beta-glucanase (GH16 family)